MTSPCRALCAELLVALKSWSPHGGGPLECWEDREEEAALIARAEALLAQPKPAPKPVVDYSRVPEIATEAQIRAAAQYLVKKRHCDGDLIPAIEYAIARWGRAANALAQPEPEEPTDDKLMDIARETDLVYYMGKGYGFARPYTEETDITAKVLAFARKVRALDNGSASNPAEA